MELGIHERVALVAAASRGLGYAAARGLAQEGAKVSICGRDAQAIADAAEQLRKETGAEVVAFEADLADDRQAAKWVADTEAALGPIEILVANGPGPKPGRFVDLDDADWRRACDVVLVSIARQIRLVLPSMTAGGWGRIVVINSFTARQPLENLTLSNAVRAGALGLAKTVASEVASTGVTVNSVLPGPTSTERLAELIQANAAQFGTSEEDATRALIADAPINRLATPEEVAAAVLFLCSQSAGMMTGVALPVDGGALRST